MKNIKSVKSIFLALIIFFVVLNTTGAQNSDTIRRKSIVVKSILPTSLIVAGSLISGSKFEKDIQTNLRNAVGNNYVLHIDDYLQYVPVAELYIADIAGIKSKNHWFDQTKYLLISNILTASITHGLKFATGKTRPNGGVHSFPSGHTTFAFTNATVLYNEFIDSSPALAYSGYLLSTTTGVFRMINNRHWLSDVMVGAGIGILVTNLVYYFEPFKNFNPFKKTKNIVLIPNIDYNSYGLYFSYRF